ncbi:MAG: hypothetical protein ACI9IP_001881 [Arcticibacterium sp.]|jgi:hypothetical protein
MEQKELSELTNEELLADAKKMKSNSIMSALLIGFMAGIIIFSVVKNTWGFLTLIPLYLIYRMVTNSKKNDALKKELEARDLK